MPQRTCVACRRIRPQRELVRLVRRPGGEIEIDTAGKKEGRGAYLCPERACWEKALKGSQLEHTLRGGLSQESRQRLAAEGEEIIKGAD